MKRWALVIVVVVLGCSSVVLGESGHEVALDQVVLKAMSVHSESAMRRDAISYHGGPIDFEELEIGVVDQPLVFDRISFECYDLGSSTLFVGPDPQYFLSVGGLDGTQALEYAMSASWTPGYIIKFNPAVQWVRFDVNPYSSITEVRIRAFSPESDTVIYDQMHPVPGVILIEAGVWFDRLWVGDSFGGYFAIDNFDIGAIFFDDFESGTILAWN